MTLSAGWYYTTQGPSLYPKGHSLAEPHKILVATHRRFRHLARDRPIIFESADALRRTPAATHRIGRDGDRACGAFARAIRDPGGCGSGGVRALRGRPERHARLPVRPKRRQALPRRQSLERLGPRSPGVRG